MSDDARPFLPEPEPDPALQPKPKTAARKTLALWGLLILMFLVIWQVLQPSPAQHRRDHARTTHVRDDDATPAPCEDTGHIWTSALTLVPLGLFGLFMFYFMRTYRASHTFNAEVEPGLLALAERRFSVAAEVFQRAIDKNAGKVNYEATARYNLGWTQLWSGQLDEAIASLAKVEKTTGLFRTSGIRLRGAQDLALLYALKGDFATSQRWVDDSRARLAKSGDDRTYAGSKLCLAEAILSVRHGDAASAVASLERRWLLLRGTLDTNTMRVVEVVRAFAETGGGVRQYNTVQERLIRVEPVAGNEFAFLGVRWPEMQAFLISHQLVKSSG